MKMPDWKNPQFRRRFFGVLTTLLVLSFAMHPELRLLVPLLDAVGIDVLISLLSIQALSLFTDLLLPSIKLFRQDLAPHLQAIGRFALSIPVVRTFLQNCSDLLCYGGGVLGLFVWLKIWSLSLGPNYSFKPSPLRGSA